MKSDQKELSPKQREGLLSALKERFERNLSRHLGVDWARVNARLEAKPDKRWSLAEMERTGGEPEEVGQDEKSGAFVFMDCAPESPAGRRSVCDDREGLETRKEHRPKTTAMDMAADLGIALLTEEEYFTLQKLGEFDTKSSSWIATPMDIRERGGALYGEARYGRIFVGHNGAQSYYGARGFRGGLRVCSSNALPCNSLTARARGRRGPGFRRRWRPDTRAFPACWSAWSAVPNRSG